MTRARSVGTPPTRPIRRRRALSAEELQLWDQVARTAKPLRKARAPAPLEGPAQDDAASPSALPETLVRDIKAAAASKAAKQAVQPPAHPPLAPIGRRERSHLVRGRKDIEARLDLHGMTQVRAHSALRKFLVRAQDEGFSFVLVITGKGSGQGGEGRGILRRLVPEWLGLPEFRGLVVGFEEAHLAHGGSGALYVRVRRVR